MRKWFFRVIFLAFFLFLGAVVPSEVRADCKCVEDKNDVCVVVEKNDCNQKTEIAICRSHGTDDRSCRPNSCECVKKSNSAFCDDGATEIRTTIGCIPIARDAFVTWFLNRLFGIIGGIAFLLMVGGGIQIAASGGDPAKMKAGQEMLSSAVAGLLLALFSLFILRLIMVDILQIPGMN